MAGAGQGAGRCGMSAVMRGLERVAADRRHLIAAQVRCSTGFTWGMVVEGVAKLPAMPVWLRYKTSKSAT